jgi:hypothetical protein
LRNKVEVLGEIVKTLEEKLKKDKKKGKAEMDALYDYVDEGLDGLVVGFKKVERRVRDVEGVSVGGGGKGKGRANAIGGEKGWTWNVAVPPLSLSSFFPLSSQPTVIIPANTNSPPNHTPLSSPITPTATLRRHATRSGSFGSGGGGSDRDRLETILESDEQQPQQHEHQHPRHHHRDHRSQQQASPSSVTNSPSSPTSPSSKKHSHSQSRSLQHRHHHSCRSRPTLLTKAIQTTWWILLFPIVFPLKVVGAIGKGVVNGVLRVVGF